ncbi:formyl transferase [Tribonema minus]|uniref:Methionyl-tRNA formyltransferase, mitochondrial n=1 Tax=Tribonema minus TaxID=303371 RepID=A0A835YXF4_9STRA|nr:formyl transferase [Tribonema minus]
MSGSDSPAARKKVVFLGTPDVAAHSLSLLLEASSKGEGGGFDISAVVTQPPARTGRGKKVLPSAVHQLADQHGLPVMVPERARDPEFLEALRELGPDLCITAAYGQFLPQKFLDIPRHGTLNIHPSLLPKYRGASPVQRCLQAGDAVTGVTILFTELKMDSGPVLRQRSRALRGDEKAPALLRELFADGAAALVGALPEVWDGSAQPVAQDDAQATEAPKLDAAEARCDFAKEGARAIHNKVRAFAGWPGTWVRLAWGGRATKVKLVTTAVGEGAGRGGRGVVLAGGALEVTCRDGSVLRVLEVQPEGKRVMDARSFVNGARGAAVTWVDEEEEGEAGAGGEGEGRPLSQTELVKE